MAIHVSFMISYFIMQFCWLFGLHTFKICSSIFPFDVNVIDTDFNLQREARYSKGMNSVEGSDPYDTKDFAMPLREYINHPVAWDIVHNGATFQVL